MTKGLVHETPVAATVEWYTPAWVFERLGLRFAVDVASPEAGPVPWVPSDKFVTPSMDGLVTPYEGLAWCNPPYGPLTLPFLKRMHEHGNGVALVFARTDTKWFHQYVAKADAICFLNGRIRFVDVNGKEGGSPGCGSMLVAWGEESVAALYRSKMGLIVKP